jgi:hypothetical protein
VAELRKELEGLRKRALKARAEDETKTIQKELQRLLLRELKIRYVAHSQSAFATLVSDVCDMLSRFCLLGRARIAAGTG